MAKSKPTFDVFLSHSYHDKEFSATVARILESYELRVFSGVEMTSGNQVEDMLWDAMAESQAFVAIIPENEPHDWIAFELGAAKAWNKPIYAIAANPTTARLPIGLQGIVIYPFSRVEEIARKIKQSSGSFPKSEEKVLVEIYHQVGLPVDQLVLQPNQLTHLTNQFERLSKLKISSEELVRNLLRLRKNGALRMPDLKKRTKATKVHSADEQDDD